MKITDGEIIKLSDNKEYVCITTLTDNIKNYIVLMGNYKPVEVKFGEQIINGDKIEVRIINNQEEKLKVMELFKNIIK